MIHAAIYADSPKQLKYFTNMPLEICAVIQIEVRFDKWNGLSLTRVNVLEVNKLLMRGKFERLIHNWQKSNKINENMNVM